MPPNTVYVGRPTVYGNPYTLASAFNAGISGTEDEILHKIVAMYRRAWDLALESANMHPREPPMPFGEPIFLGPLRGKDLACWCPLDQPCHADVLLELANK